MASSNNKPGGLSSLGIPGRGLSYITPFLKGHKASRKKRIIRGAVLFVFLIILTFVGIQVLLVMPKNEKSTLTVDDIVTQTWQAQTRMAEAISTVQVEMLDDLHLTEKTPEPSLTPTSLNTPSSSE